ncbi:MAG: radical SAM family heme chaperone HemW [Spirochaetales bacterium]|nr:radical SAM family heme chaperone HemW [Spirochaetales bacterium]
MNDVSLYFHIPFCTAKCDYCDFFSISDYSSCSPLIKALLAEFSRDFTRFGKPPVASVFIGGGTPNSVPLQLLVELLDGIAEITGADTDVEWTIEANPEHITREFIHALHDSRVSRLSIGVQSFDHHMLRILNRNASLPQTIDGLDTACNFFSGDISIDLICEIPGQTVESALNDIRQAMVRGIPHISRYSLTIEDGTPFHRKYRDLYTGNDEVYAEGISFLAEQGYVRYEVSNFSKKGYQCRHNLRYWNMDPYLGFGPSSVSTAGPGVFSEQMRMAKWIRREQTASLDAYIAAVAKEDDSLLLHKAQEEDGWYQIEWKDLLFEHFIMGLRTYTGIQKRVISERFPSEYVKLFADTCAAAAPFLIEDGNSIRIRDEYMDSQNPVLLKILDTLDSVSGQS